MINKAIDIFLKDAKRHTPGPWHAAPNVDQGNSWELCHGIEGRKQLPATYANARLIATAPDMASLLRQAVKYLDHPEVKQIPFVIQSGVLARRINKLLDDMEGK